MKTTRPRNAYNTLRPSKIIILVPFLLLQILLIVSPSGAFSADAREIAKEAYYQIEANVFNPKEIRDAINKIKMAYTINSKEAYIQLSLSLATLVGGYTKGDWYEKGTFTDGTIDKSYVYAKEAVALDPLLAQTYAHLARLSIIKRNTKDCISYLQKSKQLDNTSFYPWYFEGILFEKTGSPLNALQSFKVAEKYISHDHQRTILNTHRQNVASLMKDTVTQEKLLKENIANNLDDPHVYGNYAAFLKQHKRYKESIAQWEKALEKGRYLLAEKQLVETKRLLETQRGRGNDDTAEK